MTIDLNQVTYYIGQYLPILAVPAARYAQKVYKLFSDFRDAITKQNTLTEVQNRLLSEQNELLQQLVKK